MFSLNDYEDEILEKLIDFFDSNGEQISEDVLSILAEEISALLLEQAE